MSLRALLEVDARWSARLRLAEGNGPLRVAAILLAHSGDSWFWLLGLAVVWWRGDAPLKTWALTFALAIAVTAALVMALKFAFRRRRPEGDWGAIYRSTDPHSFPSGHAARAFLLAVLAARWGPPWMALVLIPWAPLVCLARVAMGVHYLSDVVVGGALGLILGLLIAVLLP